MRPTRTLLTGLLAAAALVCAAAAAASVTLDQEPILRVVRASDLPESTNQYLPTGALTAQQLSEAAEPSPAAVRSLRSILARHGYGAGAISAFSGPGRVQWRSRAAEFSSPGSACAAVAPAAALDARSQAPPHDRAVIGRDAGVPRSRQITFTPPVAAWAGGVEIIACAGDYVYTLQYTGKPSTSISATAATALLTKVIARTG
jgi:hypothetical protein